MSRAVTFENPTGEAGRGGVAAAGRKGAPNRIIRAGERVTLVDLAGPGRITHLWFAIGSPTSPRIDAPPADLLRRQVLEVRYEDRDQPSVSVPVCDWFGAAHGRPVPYASALTAVNEGRGCTSRIPLPFRSRLVLDWVNDDDRPVLLYYQADVLLGPLPDDVGYLHAGFRRENPTTEGRDFVVTDGLRGPGRFLGCTGGVRVTAPQWWGEGEVKLFLDGDHEHPTICGTGFEDYLDSAWTLGSFAAPESGAPLVLTEGGDPRAVTSYVSFYRWHLSDPVVFQRDLRVTVQQIGSAFFLAGQEAEFERFASEHTVAGEGWLRLGPGGGLPAFGLFERSDDWCATAFVYCTEPQAVPRCDPHAAAEQLDEPPPGHRMVHRTT